jgi:hypothetical protein
MAKTKLIELMLENKPGSAAGVTEILAGAGVNILSIFGSGPLGVVQLVVDDPNKAAKALKAAAILFNVAKGEIAELPNKPGSLHGLLKKLAKKGINLRSIAATTTKAGRKSIVLYTTDDAPKPSTPEAPPPQM